MSDIKVFTLTEVSTILKVSRRTLYNYIKDGKLKAFKVGKGWRISEQALQDFTSIGTTSVK